MIRRASGMAKAKRDDRTVAADGAGHPYRRLVPPEGIGGPSVGRSSVGVPQRVDRRADTVEERRDATVNLRRRAADPRIVASVAFVIAAAAIALELAYSIGRFAITTVEQIHS
jgi:hypothetical protein